MSNKLTKAQILGAADIVTEEVHVPEWDGSVLVRGLTGAQRDEFELSLVEQHGRKQVWHREDVRAKLLVLSIVDEEGNRLFSEGDIQALSQKSASALERLFNVSRRLSGLSDTDVAELSKN